MIGRIKGIIVEQYPPHIILETHGMGYEVHMPMNFFNTILETGQEIIIYTHLIVQDSAQLLFGFLHNQERWLFRELIKISGVGPKLAMSTLSSMPVPQFMSAIEYQDINMLVQLPGIGKKTAERLIVEMKDRLSISAESCSSVVKTSTSNTELDHKSAAVAALVVLGYKRQEASIMVNKVARTGTEDCEVLIRNALRAAL